MIPKKESARLRAERDALPKLEVAESEFLAACTSAGMSEEQAQRSANMNKSLNDQHKLAQYRLSPAFAKIGEMMLAIKGVT